MKTYVKWKFETLGTIFQSEPHSLKRDILAWSRIYLNNPVELLDRYPLGTPDEDLVEWKFINSPRVYKSLKERLTIDIQLYQQIYGDVDYDVIKVCALNKITIDKDDKLISTDSNDRDSNSHPTISKTVSKNTKKDTPRKKTL